METGDFIVDYDKVLGEGASGKVYVGHPCSDSESQIAIKICNLNGRIDTEKARLRREIGTLKKLQEKKHANIVQFIDHCTEGDSKIFMALQL